MGPYILGVLSVKVGMLFLVGLGILGTVALITLKQKAAENVSAEEIKQMESVGEG